MSLFTSFFGWLTSLFWSKTAEISIVGLQASGKTSFLNLLALNQFDESKSEATVSFNLRKVRKGNVTMKVWDVAGQPKFRSMWERYCKDNDAIVFVVDSTDKGKFEAARFELHSLLSNPILTGIPLLVLGNKCDLVHLEPASVQDLIEKLQLDKIEGRPVSCYSCSMKDRHNLDIIIRWLTERGH